MILIALAYLLAATVGALAAEFVYFSRNQHKYNGGRSVAEQFSSFLADRWDNFLVAIFIAGLAAIVFYGVDVNALIEKQFGLDLEGMTSYGLTALSAFMSEWIVSKVKGKAEQSGQP